MVEEEEADLDEAFELVAESRRRAVLAVLRTAPRGSLERMELAGAVTRLLEHEDEETTRQALVHQDLPKLAEADVIEYDRETGVVTYDSDPLVERCLDVAETYHSENWLRSPPEQQ